MKQSEYIRKYSAISSIEFESNYFQIIHNIIVFNYIRYIKRSMEDFQQHQQRMNTLIQQSRQGLNQTEGRLTEQIDQIVNHRNAFGYPEHPASALASGRLMSSSINSRGQPLQSTQMRKQLMGNQDDILNQVFSPETRPLMIDSLNYTHGQGSLNPFTPDSREQTQRELSQNAQIKGLDTYMQLYNEQKPQGADSAAELQASQRIQSDSEFIEGYGGRDSNVYQDQVFNKFQYLKNDIDQMFEEMQNESATKLFENIDANQSSFVDLVDISQLHEEHLTLVSKTETKLHEFEKMKEQITLRRSNKEDQIEWYKVQSAHLKDEVIKRIRDMMEQKRQVLGEKARESQLRTKEQEERKKQEDVEKAAKQAQEARYLQNKRYYDSKQQLLSSQQKLNPAAKKSQRATSQVIIENMSRNTMRDKAQTQVDALDAVSESSSANARTNRQKLMANASQVDLKGRTSRSRISAQRQDFQGGESRNFGDQIGQSYENLQSLNSAAFSSSRGLGPNERRLITSALTGGRAAKQAGTQHKSVASGSLSMTWLGNQRMRSTAMIEASYTDRAGGIHANPLMNSNSNINQSRLMVPPFDVSQSQSHRNMQADASPKMLIQSQSKNLSTEEDLPEKSEDQGNHHLESECNVDLEEADELNSFRGGPSPAQEQENLPQKNVQQNREQQEYLDNEELELQTLIEDGKPTVSDRNGTGMAHADEADDYHRKDHHRNGKDGVEAPNQDYSFRKDLDENLRDTERAGRPSLNPKEQSQLRGEHDDTNDVLNQIIGEYQNNFAGAGRDFNDYVRYPAYQHSKDEQSTEALGLETIADPNSPATSRLLGLLERLSPKQLDEVLADKMRLLQLIANQIAICQSQILGLTEQLERVEELIESFLGPQMASLENMKSLSEGIQPLYDQISALQMNQKQARELNSQLGHANQDLNRQLQNIQNGSQERLEQASKLILGVQNQNKEKLQAWELELRELQDKCQHRQIKIDAYEQQLRKEQMDKNEARFEVSKIKKEIEIMYNSLHDKGFLPSPSHSSHLQNHNMFKPSLATAAVQEIMIENERLKEEIQKVVLIALKDYYELSKYNQVTNNVEDQREQAEVEEVINSRIGGSILELREIQNSQYSYNCQSTFREKMSVYDLEPNRDMGLNLRDQESEVPDTNQYIKRYQEIIREAKAQFLADLSQLQHELKTSRKLFIQLRKEKLDSNKLAEEHGLKNNSLSNEIAGIQYQLGQHNARTTKQKVEIQRLEAETQSLGLQIDKLEQVKESKDAQILKMGEEIKFQLAAISKSEHQLFEYQTELQRKKQQALEMQQSLGRADEEKVALAERIEQLMIENEDLGQQVQNDIQEEVMKDVLIWANDCQMFNENYLENQQLMNELEMTTADQQDTNSIAQSRQGDDRSAFEVVNIEEVSKIIKKISKHSRCFEPMRQKLRTNVFLIEKKINDYRQIVAKKRQSERHKKSLKEQGPSMALSLQSQFSLPPEGASPSRLNGSKKQIGTLIGSLMPSKQPSRVLKDEEDGPKQAHGGVAESVVSGFVQDIDYTTVNQELRLRLDICQDEVFELTKQLKSASIRAHTSEEYKVKLDHVKENFKQLRSMHSLMIETIKKHMDSGSCQSSGELQKVIDKLSHLPRFTQNPPSLNLDNHSIGSQHYPNRTPMKKQVKTMNKNQSMKVTPTLQVIKQRTGQHTPNKAADVLHLQRPQAVTEASVDGEAAELFEQAAISVRDQDLGSDQHSVQESFYSYTDSKKSRRKEQLNKYMNKSNKTTSRKIDHSSNASQAKPSDRNHAFGDDGAVPIELQGTSHFGGGRMGPAKKNTDCCDQTAQTEISCFNMTEVECQTVQPYQGGGDALRGSVSFQDMSAFIESQTMLIEKLANQGSQFDGDSSGQQLNYQSQPSLSQTIQNGRNLRAKSDMMIIENASSQGEVRSNPMFKESDQNPTVKTVPSFKSGQANSRYNYEIQNEHEVNANSEETTQLQVVQMPTSVTDITTQRMYDRHVDEAQRSHNSELQNHATVFTSGSANSIQPNETEMLIIGERSRNSKLVGEPGTTSTLIDRQQKPLISQERQGNTDFSQHENRQSAQSICKPNSPASAYSASQTSERIKQRQYTIQANADKRITEVEAQAELAALQRQLRRYSKEFARDGSSLDLGSIVGSAAGVDYKRNDSILFNVDYNKVINELQNMEFGTDDALNFLSSQLKSSRVSQSPTSNEVGRPIQPVVDEASNEAASESQNVNSNRQNEQQAGFEGSRRSNSLQDESQEIPEVNEHFFRMDDSGIENGDDEDNEFQDFVPETLQAPQMQVFQQISEVIQEEQEGEGESNYDRRNSVRRDYMSNMNLIFDGASQTKNKRPAFAAGGPGGLHFRNDSGGSLPNDKRPKLSQTPRGANAPDIAGKGGRQSYLPRLSPLTELIPNPALKKSRTQIEQSQRIEENELESSQSIVSQSYLDPQQNQIE